MKEKNNNQKNQVYLDDIFTWNSRLASGFTIHQIGAPWIAPVIQGYVGQFRLPIGNNSLIVSLICRRSCKRGGTRFCHRGIDAEGYVANFCENEQIVEFGQTTLSWIAIRGSIPLFWEQAGMQADLQLTRGKNLNDEAQANHFKILDERYLQSTQGKAIEGVENDNKEKNQNQEEISQEDTVMQQHNNHSRNRISIERGQFEFVFIINLLTEGDKNEQMLTEAFEDSLGRSIYSTPKRYEQFDFHKRSGDVDIFSQNLAQQAFLQGYIKEKYKNINGNGATNSVEVIQEQQGLLRVNCKDCLDRTNSVMAKVAYYHLLQMLAVEFGLKLGVNNNEGSDKEISNNNTTTNQQLSQKKIPSQSEIKSTNIWDNNNNNNITTTSPSPGSQPSQHIHSIGNLLQTFLNNLWTRNGNNISKLYAGTDATTKNASSGFQYKFDTYVIGLQRFVNSSISDAFKMECINIITCNHFDSVYNDGLGEIFSRQLYNKREAYQTRHNLSIFITTWNVMTLVPNLDIEFPGFLDLNGQTPPELIVVGLEEIIKSSKYSLSNIFGKTDNKEQTQLWTRIISKQISRSIPNTQYMLIDSRNMVGNFMAVFASANLQEQIKNVETESVKCGLAKKGADVGGLICRLTINETMVCLVHCYLPGGRSSKKIEQRFKAIEHIHTIAFQKDTQGRSKTLKIDQSNMVFLFGDLNFRLNIQEDQAYQLIDKYKQFMKLGETGQAQGILTKMLGFEQLQQNRHNNQTVSEFVEGIISFLPTFQPNPTTHDQTPCWQECLFSDKNYLIDLFVMMTEITRRNRILFNLNDEFTSINQKFYTANQQLQASNHKQVSAYFEISTKKTDTEARNKLLNEMLSQQKMGQSKE